GDGRTDAALATLHPLLEGQRFRGIFALHSALIADVGGRQDDAAELYRVAQSEMQGTNLRLAQMLATWQMRTGHETEAQQTFAALAETAPDLGIVVPALQAGVGKRPIDSATDGLAEAYLALGAALQAQDSKDLAMVMLQLALDLRADFVPARLLASDILSSERHDPAALQMIALVPDNDPLSPVIRLRRAFITDKLGHTAEALRDLNRLGAEFPESVAPVTQQGDILRGRQRYPEAIAAYTHALARIPGPGASQWAIYYARGIAYERSRQWPSAEADLRHALELAPDQPSVLNYLGYSWADMGQHLPEARRMIQKAVDRRPNDGALTDSLGWVMLRQGEVGNAVRTLEQAVELDPEDSTVNSHLGDAYWAAGRKLEAQYQWRRALTLNPAPDDVAKLEAKLQSPPKSAIISGQ
ncbi:MAG: tetratricopeptide repeat protein, partial [Acetobacteraceae bacterium]|nr:tetratricopeptide repeat protein [Acetobacteraceae bacterium]